MEKEINEEKRRQITKKKKVKWVYEWEEVVTKTAETLYVQKHRHHADGLPKHKY